MSMEKEILELTDLISMVKNKQVTIYRIHKETGVGYSTLNGLVTGERTLKNITIDVAQRLLKFKSSL